eukprot:2674005-Amphidinium_carterae.1
MGTPFHPLRDWRLLKFYGRMMGTPFDALREWMDGCWGDDGYPFDPLETIEVVWEDDGYPLLLFSTPPPK